MNLEKVCCTLLLGNDFDYILFKTAIFYAELGFNVWFISPETFEKIPESIISPEKEVLQLITFFYLKDHEDLITHLNGIHLWHKMPRIIILSGFDKYCDLSSKNYNALLTSLLCTTLLDSMSVCARKNQNSCYLILTSTSCEHFKDRLQVVQDMYFPHVIKIDDSKLCLDKIIDYFKLIK